MIAHMIVRCLAVVAPPACLITFHPLLSRTVAVNGLVRISTALTITMFAHVHRQSSHRLRDDSLPCLTFTDTADGLLAPLCSMCQNNRLTQSVPRCQWRSHVGPVYHDNPWEDSCEVCCDHVCRWEIRLVSQMQTDLQAAHEQLQSEQQGVWQEHCLAGGLAQRKPAPCLRSYVLCLCGGRWSRTFRNDVLGCESQLAIL